jgi:hypothetical protein
MSISKRLLAGAGVVMTATSASAFYFPDWPGAVRRPQPAILTDQIDGDPPSVIRHPTPTQEITTPPDPQDVPEPGTIVLASIGLAIGVRASHRLTHTSATSHETMRR